MENELIKMFVGSDIEAQYIASLLKENGIEAILRNSLEESLRAGWAAASPNNSTAIFVEAESQGKAEEIISEYKTSIFS